MHYLVVLIVVHVTTTMHIVSAGEFKLIQQEIDFRNIQTQLTDDCSIISR